MKLARHAAKGPYAYTRLLQCSPTLGLYNVPIPASPTLAASSSTYITKVNSWAGPASLVLNTYNSVNDFDVPYYKASASDPLFTISADLGSYGFSYPVNGMQIHIPDAAKAAGGSDGHLVVEDENGGWIYEFWAVTAKPGGGGTLVCSSAGRIRKNSGGFGNAGAIASQTAGWAGRPQARELKVGQIGHALGIVLKSTDGTHVWPANQNAAAGDPTNAPPCGSWLQLNMTPAAIIALGLPAWKTAILTALAVYGGVVDDTGGSSWNMRFWDDASTASLGGAQPLGALSQTLTSLGWSAGSPSFGDLKSGVTWSNLRVLDSAYMQGLYEARQAAWKLDPIATVSNNWTLTGGATAHACLTDTAYPPFSATSTLRIGTQTTNNVAEVRVATPSAPTGLVLTGLVAWFHGNTATGTTYRMDLKSGTTVIGTVTMVANAGAQYWYGAAATTLAGLDPADIRISIVCVAGAGGFGNVYAAHVMAEYS